MKFSLSDPLCSTPSYAFAEVDKLVENLKKQGITPIDFGVGDPKEPTPDFVIDSLYASAKQESCSGYPQNSGSKWFKKGCAEYMKKRFGVDLDPETEIVSNIGSKEAIFNFPLAYINPGDIVIVPSPGYPPMRTGTRFCRGEVYSVGLFEENDFLIDYESIPKDIAQKAKIMWLNYPNSPTGKTADLEYYKGLIEWAKKYNIILACDEGCYIDIYFQDKKPHSILELTTEGVVCFYSNSKRNNMTGYRCGFVCGDKEIISAFSRVKNNIDSGTPTFIQKAGLDAFLDEDHAEHMRQEYKKKQDILLKALEEAGLPRPQIDATFYVWQKAPSGMTGVELAKKLLDPSIGIVTTPGEWISEVESITQKNPGKQYIRFALVPTVEEVQDAVERIKNLVI